MSSPPTDSEHHPRQLIPQLCGLMYNLGWLTGTAGAMSIRDGEDIYVTPSSVQKERMKPEDLFVLDINQQVKSGPSGLKPSDCTELFLACYRLRNAGAVIHSHSMSALLATLITTESELRISHQEMIKGIKKGSSNESYRYDDTLVIPIIENAPFEQDLTGELERVILEYPDTNAVLVRRHGVFVWGKTWQAAKTMTECYDYLFDYVVKLNRLGVDFCLE